MSYYAKDCLFMFFIGLPLAICFRQGAACWAAICLGRYLWIRMDWKKTESNYCKTKDDFLKRGYKDIPDEWFDDDGMFHPERTPLGRK